jgi:N-acetylglucosaminyl-diphospho-decaprenol L-rhamnosyltransferase
MARSSQESRRGLRFLREDGKPAVAEITVILVSWNDADEARACVETLAAARNRIAPGGPRASLVVVANGGDLPGAERIGSSWPDARLIVNETNRGLAPAANQGAAVATGDILLFLNPDTRAEGDPYSEIARAFVENPEAVAVAPRLLDAAPAGQPVGSLAAPDREDQFTFQLRRLPTLSSDARQLLLIDHLRPNNSGRRRDRYADDDRETAFVIEQAAGAALAVRRKAFGAVGGFDEQFAPAWFEDVDLCARLAREGVILFWPHARFRHTGGVSARQLGYARFLPIYYRNALRYRERYSSPERLLYRALLVAGMLLRLAALPLRPTVPRPRAEAAQAYVRTLGVALGFRSRHSQFSILNSQFR